MDANFFLHGMQDCTLMGAGIVTVWGANMYLYDFLVCIVQFSEQVLSYTKTIISYFVIAIKTKIQDPNLSAYCILLSLLF